MTEDRAKRQRELLTPYITESDVRHHHRGHAGAPSPAAGHGGDGRDHEARLSRGRPGRETGGNVEGSVAGEEVVVNGVRIWGAKDVASQMPVHASQLYAMNVRRALLASMASPDPTTRLRVRRISRR